MTYRRKPSYPQLIFLVILLLVIGGAIFWQVKHPQHAVAPVKTQSVSQVKKPASTSPTTFDKSQYSINQADSLWVVVNKGRVLPSTYTPANLVIPNVPLADPASSSQMQVRADTAKAMETMFAAAKTAGINLMVTSGYRSYSYQVTLYNNYVKTQGQAAADTFSARPGHSEHQTGLAADLQPANGKCALDDCFADTPEGQWLAANSYKYGFIIRYQKDTQNLTGYEYEPWHVRYIGIPLAAQIHSSNQTLEQFFGLPAITDYPPSSYQLKTN